MSNKATVKDTVFTIKDGEWKAYLNGQVLHTEWNSRGAAEAGLAVERRRRSQTQRKESPREPPQE